MQIAISLNIHNTTAIGDLTPEKQIIDASNMPKLKKISFKIDPVDAYEYFDLYYIVRESTIPNKPITALSIDGRTMDVSILSKGAIPATHEAVFILYSILFSGKVTPSRQELEMSEQEIKTVKSVFKQKVAEIIDEEIPQIKEENKIIQSRLNNKYPHLIGLFNSNYTGLINENDALEDAQRAFFLSQKEILNATSLTDDQYTKSLEVSSRALTEYILFRQVTIEKLRNSTDSDSEAELHKLFASMRKEGKFEKENFSNDLYRNNAWLLDDKYMTYETVLSDREMGELIKVITDEETKDDDRPDIALIFSNDPNNQKPFDVVIVELKKRGISLEENMKVTTQLEKRARKLLKHYNNQIQRIWFYGIIEFNEEVELALAGQYIELYSSGKMYYRETDIAISLDPKVIIPIGVFIWDLDAVINDAAIRNSAFLNIIKKHFSE